MRLGRLEIRLLRVKREPGILYGFSIAMQIFVTLSNIDLCLVFWRRNLFITWWRKGYIPVDAATTVDLDVIDGKRIDAMTMVELRRYVSALWHRVQAQ